MRIIHIFAGNIPESIPLFNLNTRKIFMCRILLWLLCPGKQGAKSKTNSKNYQNRSSKSSEGVFSVLAAVFALLPCYSSNLLTLHHLCCIHFTCPPSNKHSEHSFFIDFIILPEQMFVNNIFEYLFDLFLFAFNRLSWYNKHSLVRIFNRNE